MITETDQKQSVKQKFKKEYRQQLHDRVYQWFVQPHSKDVPLSSPILQ